MPSVCVWRVLQETAAVDDETSGQELKTARKGQGWETVNGTLLEISAPDRMVIYCGVRVTGWQFHRG